MESDQPLKAEVGKPSEYTISEVANALNVSSRTLRVYVDQGLLHPRHDGAAPVFDDADLARLELILRAKRLGLSKDEIHEFITSRDGVSRSAAVEQMTRMARDTFGSDEKARRWLRRPTTALADLTPMDALSADESGVQKVVDLLKRIDHGLSV